MAKFYHSFSLTRWRQMPFHSLFFGFITTLSLVSSTLIYSTKVDAQTPAINDAEMTNYARSLLKMEPARQQALQDIKKIIGDGDVPPIVCNDSNSITKLPEKARDIAVNYCQRSQKIVEENQLSIDRFNGITMQLQNNEDLKKLIYNRLLRIQKSPNSP
jgi:predicted helicase